MVAAEEKNSTRLKKNPLPVFIVSSGRSGTTLLRSMLNISSEFHIPHESDFIARAYPYFSDKTSFSERDYVQLIKMFFRESYDNGWNLKEEYLLDELKSVQPKSFTEVNETIYHAFLKQNNYYQKRWGIKAPVLIASVNEIVDVFPNAKIIHLVRDGRDVCASYKKVHDESTTSAFGPKSTLTNALYWIDGLRRVRNFPKRDAILEIRYEDLVDEPEATIKSVCAFIDIHYEESMCKDYFKKVSNNRLTQKELNGIHKNVSSPILKNNKNKFLKALKKKQILLYELLAYPYLKSYDYPLTSIRRDNILFRLVRTVLYQLARTYNNVRYRNRADRLYKSTL